MELERNTNKPEEQLYDLSLIDKMCRGNQKQIEKMILALLKFADTDTGAELKIAGAGAVASLK